MGPLFFDHVCRRYGDVLLHLEKDIAGDLEEFLQWAQESQQRWALTKEPMVPISWWHRLFQDFLRDRHERKKTLNNKEYKDYPVEAEQTLTLLYKNSRLAYLPAILNYVKEERATTRKVYVYCSQDSLRQEEEKKLLKILDPLLDKPGVVHLVRDPDILLGGIVLWNHWMIDCSLSSVHRPYEDALG